MRSYPAQRQMRTHALGAARDHSLLSGHVLSGHDRQAYDGPAMTGIVDPLAQGHETRPPTRLRLLRLLRRIGSGHRRPGGRGDAPHSPGGQGDAPQSPRGRSPKGGPAKTPRSLERPALALFVVLGLAAMLGGVAFLRGWGNQLRYGVSAKVVSGDTLETASERGWVRLGVGDDIPEGARVRTGSREVRLKLRDGQVWLGPDAAARLFSQHVDLIRGEAIVANPAGGVLSARWTDVTVSGSGVFRLTPGVDPRVGVYAGSVQVRRPAQSRPVEALEQLGLSTRRLPVSPAPLGYRAQDPWDRELLGEAVAFDDEVQRITRGIDVKFALGAKPPEFYRVFKAVDDATIPILKSTARTITPDGQFGPASDVLVTLFVAEAAAEATGKPLSATVTQTATWRAEGARWGLIAMRVGITASDFAETVDLSRIDQLTRQPFQIAGSENPAPVGASVAPEAPERADPPPTGQPTAAPTGAGDLDPAPSDPPQALVPLPAPVPSPSPPLVPTVPDVTGPNGGDARPRNDDTGEARGRVDRLLDPLGTR